MKFSFHSRSSSSRPVFVRPIIVVLGWLLGRSLEPTLDCCCSTKLDDGRSSLPLLACEFFSTIGDHTEQQRKLLLLSLPLLARLRDMLMSTDTGQNRQHFTLHFSCVCLAQIGGERRGENRVVGLPAYLYRTFTHLLLASSCCVVVVLTSAYQPNIFHPLNR